MSYRNAITDIPPGSTWIDRDGRIATVRQAAARCVVYSTSGALRPLLAGILETTHETQFRARWAPLYDRAAIRSQFTMSLANLGEFRVFWLPELRRIMARSISCTRHFKVPEGALLVGVYSNPCRTDAFFDDLDELLRTASEPSALRARA